MRRVSDVVVVALGLVCWIPYRRRALHLAREDRAMPRRRQACFAAGLVLLIGAVGSRGAKRSPDKVLVARMVERLFVGDIAPLLIVSASADR